MIKLSGSVQAVIMGLIVACAAGFVIWKIVLLFKKKSDRSVSSGCDGCAIGCDLKQKSGKKGLYGTK
jgi:hypothetical protein